MDKEEIKQIAYDFTTSKGDAEKLESRILSLFGVSNCFTVIKSNADKLHTDNNCDQMYHCGCGSTTLSDWNKFCPDCGVELIFQ